jgi:hypothetical protein
VSGGAILSAYERELVNERYKLTKQVMGILHRASNKELRV